MQPVWSKITDAGDALYSAENPYYEAPWYGADQLTEITVGPDGLTDGPVHWTFSVSTNATAGHFPGNRRYVCVRQDSSWAPHV